MGFTPAGYADGGSYTFHFPDGNATIARLLVRNLVPAAVPGHDCRDVVTARVDYHQLDRPSSSDPHPPVQYRGAGPQPRLIRRPCAASRSRMRVGEQILPQFGKGLLSLACWNMMIPYLCPELPEAAEGGASLLGQNAPGLYQRGAYATGARSTGLGIAGVKSPGWLSQLFSRLTRRWILVGILRSARPIGRFWCTWYVRHATRAFEHDQNRAGRAELLATPFETFEREIRDQLGRTLAARWLRSGQRHYRYHCQPLAARLRAGVQSVVGAGPAVRSAAKCDRSCSLRPDRHCQLGCRSRSLY